MISEVHLFTWFGLPANCGLTHVHIHTGNSHCKPRSLVNLRSDDFSIFLARLSPSDPDFLAPGLMEHSKETMNSCSDKTIHHRFLFAGRASQCTHTTIVGSGHGTERERPESCAGNCLNTEHVVFICIFSLAKSLPHCPQYFCPDTHSHVVSTVHGTSLPLYFQIVCCFSLRRDIHQVQVDHHVHRRSHAWGIIFRMPLPGQSLTKIESYLNSHSTRTLELGTHARAIIHDGSLYFLPQRW